LSFGIVLAPRLVVYFSDSNTVVVQYPIIEDEGDRNQSPKNSKAQRSFAKKKKQYSYKSPKEKFDPNEYTLNDWMSLGLSEKQSSVILKFLHHTVYSNEALKKIYVLPDAAYALIKDSTIYPDRTNAAISFQIDSSKLYEPVRFLELNTVDSLELISLRGVGPFYAAQIIKYRKELGGFYKKEQLLEVWKMREETYEVLVTELILDSSHIQKIHLNSISFEALKNHPYVSYSLANSIVKIRNQLGRFDTISSIKKSKLIDNEVYQKIRPYLSLE